MFSFYIPFFLHSPRLITSLQRRRPLTPRHPKPQRHVSGRHAAAARHLRRHRLHHLPRGDGERAQRPERTRPASQEAALRPHLPQELSPLLVPAPANVSDVSHAHFALGDASGGRATARCPSAQSRHGKSWLNHDLINPIAID